MKSPYFVWESLSIVQWTKNAARSSCSVQNRIELRNEFNRYIIYNFAVEQKKGGKLLSVSRETRPIRKDDWVFFSIRQPIEMFHSTVDEKKFRSSITSIIISVRQWLATYSTAKSLHHHSVRIFSFAPYAPLFSWILEVAIYTLPPLQSARSYCLQPLEDSTENFIIYIFFYSTFLLFD